MLLALTAANISREKTSSFHERIALAMSQWQKHIEHTVFTENSFHIARCISEELTQKHFIDQNLDVKIYVG